jgi:hypothetical protein
MLSSKIMLKIDNRILSLAFNKKNYLLTKPKDCPIGFFSPGGDKVCKVFNWLSK